MKKITKIESQLPSFPTRKKVAAYARVSKETERLNHSLSAQISYYSELIQNNPEWDYVGIYADDGISGTQTNRPEFQRLLEDCENKKIDIILTKSISRFARNTVDLLRTIRRLKELNIDVHFEKEHIHSLSGDGEVMLTLLSSFAQEEITSLSNNIKWSIKKSMEQGMPHFRFNIYGYRWEDDQLVIVPEEAEIVRRIFRNFLDGKSRLETEKEFEAEGIRTRDGNRWVDTNIKQILSNITYTGNLLLQKEYTVDPLTKKKKVNHGELPQYYVENNHEPIIDIETFNYVQSEIARRKELGTLANKAIHTTCFTGKIKCGNCGKNYLKTTRSNRPKNTSDKIKITTWICSTRKKSIENCYNIKLPESVLKDICAKILNLESFDESIFLEKIDYIKVYENFLLVFHFKDGTVSQYQWPVEAKTNNWTAEHIMNNRTSLQKSIFNSKNTHLNEFSGRIKCENCGSSFHKNTKKSKGSKGILFYYWRCALSSNCKTQGIREDKLKSYLTPLLGLEKYDPEIFKAMIEYISVSPEMFLTVHFLDGRKETFRYNGNSKKEDILEMK